MNNLIDRYVYDVVRRLPEKDRIEVDRELRANLYDMLPDGAGEDAVKSVLNQLGSPAKLAEKYRQSPRYLISPAFFDDYVRALKWILPLVGGIVLGIGVILGVVEAVKDGALNWSGMIASALSNGVTMGLSAAFQALVWTTVGFAVAERAGAKEGGGDRPWSVEDLPEIQPDQKGGIPLSDSIVELALTVVFSVLAILACTGTLPLAFVLADGDTTIRSFFSPEFLRACIPAIAVTAFFGVCECVVKFVYRRWTPPVCCAVVLSGLASMSAVLIVVNRSDMFSADFIDYVQGVEWGSFDLMRLFGTSGMSPVALLLSAVVVVCTLAGCAKAVYKTVRNRPR